MKPSTPAAPLRSDGAFEQYDPISNTHENVEAFDARPPWRDVAAAVVGVVTSHLRAVFGLLRSFAGFALFCALFPFTADFDDPKDGINNGFTMFVVVFLGIACGGVAIISTLVAETIREFVVAAFALALSAWAVAPPLARLITYSVGGIGMYIANAYRAELSKVKGSRT